MNCIDARDIFHKWLMCAEIEGDDWESSLCDHMCENCQFDISAENLREAVATVVRYDWKEHENK